jgi:predicted transposase YbfD/YdcC
METTSDAPAATPLILVSFAPLRDPRIARTRRHPLINIVMIVLAATLAGAKGWDEMVEFALAKFDLLARLLDLTRGVPSADTLRRVFERLDRKTFAECFAHWTAAAARVRPGDVVAIDGKSQQGSTQLPIGYQRKPIMHMVSAWAARQRLVLAAVPTERAATEPLQIKEVLDLFELQGATVTVDAIGCRGDGVARAIRAKGAHYLISLKRNAPSLYRYVSRQFEEAERRRWRGVEHSRFEERDQAHGRTERRVVWTMPAVGWRHAHGAWSDLGTIVRVDRRRVRKGNVETTTHYYVTDLRMKAETAAHRIRRRWSTENEQHWRIDVAFEEDRSQIRHGVSATNLAFVRRAALNLHLALPGARGGLLRRIKRAGWDEPYLMKLLTLDLSKV